MTEIDEAITRAYDALTDVMDIADEERREDLLHAADRARELVNSLSTLARA